MINKRIFDNINWNLMMKRAINLQQWMTGNGVDLHTTEEKLIKMTKKAFDTNAVETICIHFFLDCFYAYNNRILWPADDLIDMESSLHICFVYGFLQIIISFVFGSTHKTPNGLLQSCGSCDRARAQLFFVLNSH